MNDEYTPTTETVRDMYIAGEIEYGGGYTNDLEEAFNRWLRAHDTQVIEAAQGEPQ